MKKYLKIPTTGGKGDVYINVFAVVFAKPTADTTTVLTANITSSSGSPGQLTITHAAETDNAITRWWYDNVKRIVENPYTEVVFDATPPPFEISDIEFS